MPELPEVESLRAGLQRKVAGQKIRSVVVLRPKLVSGRGAVRPASSKKSKEFMEGLTGETIKKVDRRAKNIIFRLNSGKVILVHLKMSGQFIYQEHGRNLVVGGHPVESAEKNLPNKHTHIIFELERGILFYNDIRMFGYLLFYPDEGSMLKEAHFMKTGPEPLSSEFTPDSFFASLQKRKGNLKSVLMGQEVVAGLGNIYVDEAVFESGIRPTRSANSLSFIEAQKLHTAIQRILNRAIELGGSSVATYRLLDDTSGNYAREHKVYGKGGKGCPKCGRHLEKLILAGRTTVFCAKCQK